MEPLNDYLDGTTILATCDNMGNEGLRAQKG